MAEDTTSADKALEHVATAQEFLSTGDVDNAQTHMEQALHLAPRDPNVLTAFGSMLADVGNPERAIFTLRQAVRIQPSAGFEKYMYLGQLLGSSQEAEENMSTGIQILKDLAESLGDSASETQIAEVSSTLGSAMCSLAELRMSRAEDLATVSSDCIALLEQAAHVAPDSPEPLQVQASLQYELGDMEGALHLLRESMSKWWPPQHDSHNNVAEENAIHEASTQAAPMSGDAASSVAPQIQGHEQNDGSMATPPGQGSSSMPSYEFRVESCKLLLELDDSTEVVLEVLDHLLCEHDDIPHTWHLLALAHYAGQNFEEAWDALQYGLKVMQNRGTADDDMTAMFKELQECLTDAQKTGQGGVGQTCDDNSKIT